MTSYLNLATKDELEQIDETYEKYAHCSAYELLQLLGRMRAFAAKFITDKDREFDESLKEIPISDIERIVLKYNLRPSAAK